jgi:hypothetical protein
MKGLMIALATLLGLALTLGSAVRAMSSPVHQGPVYAVAAVRALLLHDPAAWAGRVVGVRGIAVTSGCATWPSPEDTACRDWRAGMVDADGATALPLATGAPNALLALLHRLPLAGGLVPGPQAVRWGVLATYRVRLQTAPAAVCDAAPCYQAMLLDAAPGALGG